MQNIETIISYVRNNITVLSHNILFLNEDGLKRLSYLYTIYSDAVDSNSAGDVVNYMLQSYNREDYIRYCSDIINMVKL